MSKTKVSTRKKSGHQRKAPSALNALDFVDEHPHDTIRKHLQANATELPDFLATTGQLSLKDRRTLVRQARILLEENFVHLPLKEAMHGINPVQKLSLLEHKLQQANEETAGSEYTFHRQMLEVFTSLRDLHTNYLLPKPFASRIAFMPFSVEEYFEDNHPRYIATHIVDGFTHSHFKKGVEIIHWNGVPINRAIELAADQHAGSNTAARHARGVDGLTLRALKSTLPPDENWVIVGYRDHKGVEREMRQEWIISSLLTGNTGLNADSLSVSAAAQGLDIDADIKQQARKMLFAPQVLISEIDRQPRAGNSSDSESLNSTLAGVFRARRIVTAEQIEIGYLRIYTFNVRNPSAFINEFVRLLSLLPKDGLIIDVRGNGGGHIMASEGLLQTLTPYAVTPEPTQFINTPLNASICKNNTGTAIDLGEWHQSIHEAITTGAIYSRAFPITPSEFANKWGQQYHGPVVLITDARCYSATDIFAAGFQDHDIGTIIGVDNNTGAGGANVWTHKLLRTLAKDKKSGDSFPYEPLPKGAGMRVSVRRTLRVGDRAGTPVEDIGVKPDVYHAMTRDDLLNGNIDLIERATQELKLMPVRQLDVQTRTTASAKSASTRGAKKLKTIAISATTRGLDRLDIYIDERPLASQMINQELETPAGDGQNATTIPCDISVEAPSHARLLVVAGYSGEDFVAARHLTLD